MYLTEREEQIIALVALGLGNKEIALRLGVSRRTVSTHLERLFVRYGLHSRAHAVAHWLQAQHRSQALELIGPRVADNTTTETCEPPTQLATSLVEAASVRAIDLSPVGAMDEQPILADMVLVDVPLGN